MAYVRKPHYEPGEAIMACSSCGMAYLFPSELVYANDQLFYCRRKCWHPEWRNQTKIDDARDRMVPHQDNDNPPLIGPKPGWR